MARQARTLKLPKSSRSISKLVSAHPERESEWQDTNHRLPHLLTSFASLRPLKRHRRVL